MPNTTPPVHFGVVLKETDLSDRFDEDALLRKIPKSHHKNAALLLKAFDERPNELTWDSSGNIYIDEKVIPNASIFDLFPLLFKKKASKKHNGLLDFLAKIKSMNLISLIQLQVPSKLPSLPSTDLISPTPSSSSQNWWFLGE